MSRPYPRPRFSKSLGRSTSSELYKRRKFLTQCLLAPVLLKYSRVLNAQSAVTSAVNDSASVAYVAAAQSRLGEHSLSCFNHLNEVIAKHEIAARGHGFAFNRRGHIAAIARRPADFCVVMDARGKKIVELTAPDDRHFYGHGVFDLNGDYLYLTENDFEQARGVIGIYSAANNYQRVGEFASHGVGPHMIQLDTSGRQLIVANGGIETHPAMGRKKLNLTTMQPSIVFIDIESGELIRGAQLAPQYHKNSIRHFSIGSDETVYIGLQNEGAKSSAALLAALSPASSVIEKLTLPDSAIQKLDNYVGDICLDHSEQTLLASSPYGNSLVFVDLRSGQSASYELEDVCAVSGTDQANQFIVSSGAGGIFSVDLTDGINTPSVQSLADFSPNLAWDNHLFSVLAKR